MKFSPKTWLVIGILYIIFIIYSTLLPFNFSFEVLQTNIGNIEWLTRGGRALNLTKNFDAMANILFFIPLGIIMYNIRYALGKKRHFIIDLGLATLLGLSLSIMIELAQLFIKVRTTSLVDILMNTIGCLLGALLARIFLILFQYANRKKIASFFGKLPIEIYLIPFLFLSFLINENTSANFLQSEKVGSIYFNWDYLIRPSWIWLIFYVYIPVGILFTHIMRKFLKITPQLLHYIISFSLAILVLVITEIIKITGEISSLNQENIIAIFIGVFIGTIFHEILTGTFSINKKIPSGINTYMLAGILLLMGSIIIFKSAYPLTLNFSIDYMLNKSIYSLLSTFSFVPFSKFMNLFIYSLHNILLFIPIGIILNEIEYNTRSKKNIYTLMIPSIFIIVVSFIVKIINENQIPILLEVPINVLGIFSGYLLWYGFRRVN